MVQCIYECLEVELRQFLCQYLAIVASEDNDTPTLTVSNSLRNN